MKSLSEKNRKIITILLYVFSLVLVVLIINGITAPIEFNKVKNERYLKVIDRLKDIRNAQIAYKSVNGLYSDNCCNISITSNISAFSIFLNLIINEFIIQNC